MAETEDVIQALMDTLVDHILPPRYLPFPLSKSAQNAVAEQMHAVVLLYNYYHRKQNPEQRLLSFHDFSKLAMVLKPNLSPFMKTMMENRHTELQDFDDHHLSVVEKAIKNACDVAAALDASEDFSSRKGWPISKLAVLLIDSQCENCYVEVADGGWFFIEKQVEGHGEKRKRSTEDSSTDGTKLLGLAFDAAKQITGGIENEVQVVGTHFTYATSKAKSVAVCYVMQYSGSLSCIGERQVPLMFVHEWGVLQKIQTGGPSKLPLMLSITDCFHISTSYPDCFAVNRRIEFIYSQASRCGKDEQLTIALAERSCFGFSLLQWYYNFLLSIAHSGLQII